MGLLRSVVDQKPELLFAGFTFIPASDYTASQGQRHGTHAESLSRAF